MAEKKSKATGCYLRKRRSIGSNLINTDQLYCNSDCSQASLWLRYNKRYINFYVL